MVRTSFVAALVLTGAACGARGGGAGATMVTLRPACAPETRWDGQACVVRGGADDVATGVLELAAFHADDAMAALDRAATHPLDHARHVTLWEQRGIAFAYLEREPEARAAFDTLLTLDPGHVISYKLTPRAIWLYESARTAAAERGAPRLELHWRRDQALGVAVPLELETVADPTGVLDHATIYVRTRGERAWRAADVTLAPPGQRVRALLPAVPGVKPLSLEVYAVASDRRDNEVLSWALAARPSEIALRYDPPWYRTWWVWAIACGVVAAGTGAVVYATVWEPGPLLGGGIDVN